jgi:hypothetical protein
MYPCVQSAWIIEPKAINASLLMPRMIVSGLNESVVQLVNCTDKPLSVKPGLALGMETGVRLSVVGDDNSQVSATSLHVTDWQLICLMLILY